MAKNSVMMRNRAQLLIVIPEREEVPFGHQGGFVDFQARYPELCEGAAAGLGSMGSPVGRSTSSAGGLGVASKLTLTSLSQPCLPVSNQGPTKILPFLYLGSQQDAMDQDTLSKYGIDYILNMSVGCPKPDFVQDEHFMRIAVNDSNSEKLLPYFERAFEFLDKVKEANSCVLVHCLAGISRSPTLAIAFVMRHLHMSSEEAYRYVKEKRPAISPNFNFLGQLLEFEKQLKATRQHDLQHQHGNLHGFNSITPSLKPSALPAMCSVAAGSKTAATTPDHVNAAKPFLFLNLQNTNCPAKIPVTQCSSNRDVTVTTPVDNLSMKRSSSCPVKIQRNGVGNAAGAGPLRDALNLEFEFSPATRTNVNGKRQMMPWSSNVVTASSSQEVKDDLAPADHPAEHCFSEEAMKLRSIFKEFDKVQTEKFLGSDFFSSRVPSPKMNFGIKVLKPLHEELPSPSTELSKLNFDGGGVMEVANMDVGEKASPYSANVSSVSSVPSWCPTPTVQIQSEFSSSSSITTTNFGSAFPKLPLTSTGFERRSSSGAAIMCSSATYSTCATNPFFSSSTSSGGCDYQRNVTQFGMTSKFEFSETSEPMTIEEEAAEDFEGSVVKTFDSGHRPEPSIDTSRMVKEQPTVVCYTPKDLSVTRSAGRVLSSGPMASMVSAENPLFRSTFRGSLKQRRPSSRCASVLDKSEEKVTCPLTAPALLPTSAEPRSHGIRSVRSETQLATVPSMQHLTTMREKLASARSMLVSSFSQRMRHLLTKRASWPHAVPYLAGLPASESEASALWALAPSGTIDKPAAIISMDQHMEELVKDQMAPSKSQPEIFYGFYGQHIPAIVEDASSVASTSEVRISSVAETSLLAPPFDIDSPESGFVESPTGLHHQRESTPSSTTSGHVGSSSVFLHRDPERDSLGSTSSLEIAVS